MRRPRPTILAAAAAAFFITTPAFAQQPVALSEVALAAQACNVCHGSVSYVSPTMPPIRGADANGLYASLIDLKGNKRPSTIMGRIARGYSDEQLKALAEYLSKN